LHVSSLRRTKEILSGTLIGTKNGTSPGHWKQSCFRFATAITRRIGYVTP
jgi:hypothetical protein